jgi:hypothetical protein
MTIAEIARRLWKTVRKAFYIGCTPVDLVYARAINTQPSAAPSSGRRSLAYKINQAHGTASRSPFPNAFCRYAALERVCPMAGFLRQKVAVMSITRLPYSQWREALLQVGMEMKSDSLTEKIKIAETAISQRLRELESNPGCKEERVALYNAVSTLRVLKSVLIQSHTWES